MDADRQVLGHVACLNRLDASLFESITKSVKNQKSFSKCLMDCKPSKERITRVVGSLCDTAVENNLNRLRPVPVLLHMWSQLNLLFKLLVAVQLGAMGESTSPGEDAGHRIGASGVALLMLSVVAGHCAVSCFGLHRLTVRAEQHGGHQTQ